MSFTLAIIGRPNVGKSTLFNRMAGKRLALVHDQPGVTRDWRAAPARIQGLEFTVIDTAGLEEAVESSLEGRMSRATENILTQADVALFVIDARSGLTPMDRHFADLLRRQKLPVILAANKCESQKARQGALEAYELGLGEPLEISAEHGLGMDLLFDALSPYEQAHPEAAETIDQAPEEFPEEVPEEASEESSQDPQDDAMMPDDHLADEAAELSDIQEPTDPDAPYLQLAIVGRPNVGKSTLMNTLLGQDRVLTGPEAGVTRDAIRHDFSYDDKKIRLIDTAGMRRRAKIDEKLEKYAVGDSLRAIRLAQCVVLVIDADSPLDKQDLTIARHVSEEGRAMVIAVNKWDEAADKAILLDELRHRLEHVLPQLGGVPFVTISALKNQRLDKMMALVFETYEKWNKRISTGQLNRWLEAVISHHPPPLAQGRRIKMRYMTQVNTRPPTFAIWVSKPVELPKSYKKYLINELRSCFGLGGVPVRLMLRKGDNPYHQKK